MGYAAGSQWQSAHVMYLRLVGLSPLLTFVKESLLAILVGAGLFAQIISALAFALLVHYPDRLHVTYRGLKSMDYQMSRLLFGLPIPRIMTLTLTLTFQMHFLFG
jgi:hypothetical protein